MKIGIFGDSHIPDRAFHIPEEIKKELYDCDMILCTGDLTGDEVVDFVRESGREFKIVRGNMDYLPFPKMERLEIQGKRIVLTHSDEIKPRGDKDKLLETANKYEADLFVYGHTHEQDYWEVDGIKFLNPGSVTGLGKDGKPHFVVVEIVRSSIKVRKF